MSFSNSSRLLLRLCVVLIIFNVIAIVDVTSSSCTHLQALNEGDSFNMSCQLGSEQTNSVLIWTKNSRSGRSLLPHYVEVANSPIIVGTDTATNASTVGNDDEPVDYDNNDISQVSYSFDGFRTYTLEISSLTVSDEADYTCSMLPLNADDRNNRNEIKYCPTSNCNNHNNNNNTNRIGNNVVTILSRVSVRILRPAVILSNSSNSHRVFEGQKASLYCHADGYPKPIVLWKRGNDTEPLPLGADRHPYSVLEFKASLKDSGVYKCLAFNGVGAIAFRTIAIVVTPPIEDY